MSNFEEQRLLAAQQEAKLNEEKYKIAQKLGNSIGFFQYFFEVLPKHNSHTAAFEEVNQLYYTVFGEEKYSSWDSFRRMQKRMIQKKLLHQKNK